MPETTETQETKVEEVPTQAATETTTETKAVETSTEVPVVVDPLQDIERDEDGKFVLRVNDQTVYKGATVKELLENAKNGYAAKDDYILKLKTSKVETPERKTVQTEEVLIPPSSEKILQETAAELGVDPVMLTWKPEQWREFETEHGAVYATKISNKVDSVITLAQTRLDEQNIDFINKQTLEDETAEVRLLLKEFEVNPEDFDYRKVLEAVYADDGAWKSNGVRKNGVIVRAAAKAIKDLSKAKMAAAISKTKDEELAKNRLDKSKATSETKTKATVDIPKKTPASIAEAHKQFLEELRGGT